MSASNIKPYSKATVKLLKGIVEYTDPAWEDILRYQTEIQEYVSVIGLDLIVKKDEGFAFLKQAILEDDKTIHLVTRRQLGFEVSVILIVLRQLLDEFETTRLISIGREICYGHSNQRGSRTLLTDKI